MPFDRHGNGGFGNDGERENVEMEDGGEGREEEGVEGDNEDFSSESHQLIV